MKLFKGYVKTKDKKCTMSFKNSDNLLSYDEIKRFTEFAGILDHDTVLIDIDNTEESEILYRIVTDLKLKCIVYQTSRGKHFYFKNPELNPLDKNKIKSKLAIGIDSDIKLGCKNSYAILRYNNEDRPVLYSVPENEVQELPKWLYPIGKRSTNFSNMETGDGRNQTLFNYILTLQEYDFTKEEIRECIRIINKYVLKESLNESEIETILRDDSFNQPVFFKGNVFLFDKFANYIKHNNKIVKINDILHIYEDGVYVADYKKIENVMIQFIPNLSNAKRKEVLSYLDIICTEQLYEAEANLIAFNNGIYNIIDDTFTDFTADIIFKNKIPHNYNPSAECELVDNTLNKLTCNDKQLFDLLCECVGYCFYRRNELGKSFVLTGEGSNGKSTFIDMVKSVLSEKNISSLDLSELGGRFNTAELHGKLANLGDDISEEFISNLAIFKKLVTGDRVTADRKSKDLFQFNNYAKFIFSANTIPRMKDKTGAVQRRMIIIPFNATFSKNDPDYRPFIKYELRSEEAMERLIILGIQGLKRVLENNSFSTSDKVEEALKEYEKENNSIINFVNEIGLESILNERTTLIYQKYCEFCVENGLKESFSKISFSKQMCSKYNLKSVVRKIDGKSYNIFIQGE